MSLPLRNARHERFAQELAKGECATKAHESAGFKTNRGNASNLQRRESIVNRVASIIEERRKKHELATDRAVERAAVTIESLIAEVEAARLLAMKIEQPSAAVAATREKGILAGIRVEKRESLNRYVDPDTIPDAELATIATGRGGDTPEASIH